MRVEATRRIQSLGATAATEIARAVTRQGSSAVSACLYTLGVQNCKYKWPREKTVVVFGRGAFAHFGMLSCAIVRQCERLEGFNEPLHDARLVLASPTVRVRLFVVVIVAVSAMLIRQSFFATSCNSKACSDAQHVIDGVYTSAVKQTAVFWSLSHMCVGVSV